MVIADEGGTSGGARPRGAARAAVVAAVACTLALGVVLRLRLAGAAIDVGDFAFVRHAHAHLGYYGVLFPAVWLAWRAAGGASPSGPLAVAYAAVVAIATVGFAVGGYGAVTIACSTAVVALWTASAWRDRRLARGATFLAPTPVGVVVSAAFLPAVGATMGEDPALAGALVRAFLAMLLFGVVVPAALARVGTPSPRASWWIVAALATALFCGGFAARLLFVGPVALAAMMAGAALRAERMPRDAQVGFLGLAAGLLCFGTGALPNAPHTAVAGVHFAVLGPVAASFLDDLVAGRARAAPRWALLASAATMSAAILAPSLRADPLLASQVAAGAGIGVVVVAGLLLASAERRPAPQRPTPRRGLALLEEAGTPDARAAVPLLALGFRPFFLAAGLFAAFAVLDWLGVLHGVRAPSSSYSPVVLHAHEMLFGFAMAVVAGFLLTAVRNWTGRPTPTGGALLALVLLWIAGRVAMAASASLPLPVVAALDLAFLPALLVAVGAPLLRARDRRNLFFVPLLALFFAANLLVHLDALGVLDGAALPALLTALHLIVVLLAVIGGRVIPTFTQNAIGLDVRRAPRVERAHVLALLAASLLAPAASLLPMLAPALAAACVVAGLLTLRRMRGWRTGATLGRPIVWVLHAGYACIGAGALLRGAALVSGAPAALSASTHVLAVGALGFLALGMMSRVSLGHTGRPLVASRLVVAAYALLIAAAIARAVVPLASPAHALVGLDLAGLAWAAAFSLFFFGSLPILTRPRVDGRPG